MVHTRRPAKALEEINIPEGAYKPDFELIDKYTLYASELLRLSLLGIAGYGFLVSEIVMKSSGAMNSCFGQCLRTNSNILIVGVISLGLSLILAVLYRLFSTSCIHFQVKILRGIKRMESANWQNDAEGLKQEENELADLRSKQGKLSGRCKKILQGSALFLSLGYVIVVFVFYEILKSQ